MRIVFPRWKVLLWALALLVAVVVGGVWFAYAYATDSRTLAALIRAQASRHLPGTHLDLGRVDWRPIAGVINLNHVSVRQTIDGANFQAIRIPWVRIRHDARAMLKGKFVPREVVVSHPTLRLCRRQDGTWNLQGLLAHPWPGPKLANPPPILIQNGTVELCDDDPNEAGVAILRDVSLKIVSAASGSLKFEGTAKGDAFDRLSLRGTLDPASGRAELGGDLARLEISKSLRARLPAEYRDDFDRVGLTAGEVDVWLGELVYDPSASPSIRYNASSRLRSGLWNCRPTLPFPINDLAASLSILDGVVSVDRAEGYNGPTRVRAEGTFSLGHPERAPLDMQIHVDDLEFDDRLRAWTPPEFVKLWDEYQPKGRVNVGVHAVRDREGGRIGFGMGVDCRDVAMTFDKFPYPVSQVKGRLTWEKGRIQVNLKTSVNGKPLTAKGTIDNPGTRPHVQLTFQAESLPIDRTLLDALPADVSKVVKEFQPTGTVRGVARAEWVPPKDPRDDPSKGRLTIDADIDLNERCSIKWVELPYPVEDLTGRLSIHPDKWIIQNMRGINGQAVITASGAVEADAQKRLSVDLKMQAQKLLFDQRLRDALPPAWQKSWSTLNPIGSSDVDATIKIRPGQPDRYHLELIPQQETGILLKVDRAAKPGPEAAPPLELRMDDVTGRFVFDNGTVSMQDVGFLFHGSPVRFARGQVQVKDSGAFKLGVEELWAEKLRLDAGLRKIMPPVMAQMSDRLDDGNPFTVKGNLGLGWSGQVGQPAWCRWDRAMVIFNNNSIKADLALKNMQGQIDHVRGFFDGKDFEVHGALNLDSVNIMGQQITKFESPLRVAKGRAGLEDIRGSLLGGTISGRIELSLDATPQYAATIELQGADLERYARTLSGKQSFSGLLAGRIALNGLGHDLRTLQGTGEAHVTKGDLGTLPVFLRLVNILRLPSATKSAFDSADVAISIRNGESYLDPIQFTGNAFSLHGRGTLDVQGHLDLRLSPLYGRDRMHIPGLSDAVREASGQFFIIHVKGTPANPTFKLEALPQISDGVRDTFRSLGNRRGARAGAERR